MADNFFTRMGQKLGIGGGAEGGEPVPEGPQDQGARVRAEADDLAGSPPHFRPPRGRRDER